MPAEFTTSFDTIVAISSRFNGCSGIRWPNRSTIAGGKYRRRSYCSRYSESGRSDPMSSAAIERFAYARSTASSGRTMP